MAEMWSDLRKTPPGDTLRDALGCADCTAWGNGICGKTAAEFTEDRLADLAHPETVKAGTLIAEEGALAADVFTIRQGCVRLFNLLPDGRRHVLGFLFPGDFIGLGLGESYAFSAQAIRRVRFCRFHRSSFDRVVKEQSDLTLALSNRVAEDLNHARTQLLLLGRKTAEERLASLLIWLADKTQRHGAALEDGPQVVALPMSRADIADYLGMTTETVSRLFTRFRQRDLLTSQGPSQVTLIDPEELRTLATGAVSVVGHAD